MMLANDKETARIAWHDKARPSGNQFDGAFLDGYDMGRRAMHEQIEALVTDLQGEVVAAQIRAKEFQASRDNVMFVVSDSLAQLYLGIIRRLQAILASSDGVSAEKGVTARD